MEDLLTIYYNGHFTQMCYPSAVQKQLDDWGLPLEDIDVLQYPNSKVVAPFNVDVNQNLILLTEETAPIGDTPTPMDIKTIMEEIKKSPDGLKFLKVIIDNNKVLRENNLPIVPIEFDSEDTTEPEFYSIDEKVEPVPFMQKGKMIRNFNTGKLIKE